MSLSAIRSEIKNIMEGISGIGKVYDYLRWDESSWEGFFNLFKTDSSCHGWMITRISTTEDRRFETGHNLRTYTFQIRGFYPLKDAKATEKTFQDLIETVCSTFRTNYNLNGTCLDSDPPEVSVVENRIYGSILAHYTEILLRVRERITL